jgi:hypothetical protein
VHPQDFARIHRDRKYPGEPLHFREDFPCTSARVGPSLASCRAIRFLVSPSLVPFPHFCRPSSGSMPSPPIPLIYQPSPRRNVPVYKGAPNVKEYIPPDAAIYVDDFPSLQELAKYVYEVTTLTTSSRIADRRLKQLAYCRLPSTAEGDYELGLSVSAPAYRTRSKP